MNFHVSLHKSTDSRLGLYRILKDTELFQYGYRSRTASPGWTGNPSTPATCPFNANQASQVTLSATAAVLVAMLNDPYGNTRYVTGASNGWANSGNFPMVTPLGFENNLLDIIAIDDAHGRAQFRTWNGEADDPCTIHHWWNINYDGNLFEAHNEKPGWIVLDYPDPVFVDLDRIVRL